MAEDDEEKLKRRIIKFLKELKTLLYDQPFILKPRDKNDQGFIDSGLTSKTFFYEITFLALSDYTQGPTPDETYGGEYWIFGKRYLQKEFYIKLKIVEYSSGRRGVLLLSFHRAEWPLDYPFKKSK